MRITITEDYVKDILKHTGTVRKLGTLEKLKGGGKVYTLTTHDGGRTLSVSVWTFVKFMERFQRICLKETQAMYGRGRILLHATVKIL